MQKKRFPLHPAQEDVYTDQLINIDSPQYNIGGYIKLKGALDKEKFFEAVNSAPKVFDIFKCRFDLNEPDPVSYIDPDYNKMEMAELDFSNLDDPRQEAMQWMQSRFNIPFELHKDNLPFEQVLIKITLEEYWFFGRYHHLITDGYGFMVWVKYLADKYRCLLTGIDYGYNHPPYLDELTKISEYKNSVDYLSDAKYWKDKISGRPKQLLQRKYEQEQGAGKKKSTCIVPVNEQDKVLLDKIERITSSGLQQLTIAALLIYLGKTTDHSEFVFGIPVHKRGSKRQRTVLGMFSGIVPYKASFQEEMKLSDLLLEIKQSQKRDYRHHNYPIGDLSRSLPYSSAGYFCEITINYELLNFELIFGDAIQATIFQLTSEFQGNPLQFTWRRYGSGLPLELHIHFWNEFFSREEVALLGERLLFIIKQFPDVLERNIGSIDILPSAERRLLEGFSYTSVAHPTNKSIIDIVEEQVLHAPAAVALVFEEQQLTYQQLNEHANQIAHYLRSRGVREEMLVPICIERSPEMIAGILGILKAGGAYVPIDPEYPQERINYILEDTKASVIVCSKNSRSKLATSKQYDIIEISLNTATICEQSKENLQTDILPANLAYVIYTSGSTGKPKGVMIEHKGVVNLILAQSDYFKIKRDDKILQFSNYCFDASVEQIFLALFNGAALVLFREGLQFNLDQFAALLDEQKISHLHATPFFLENLNGIKGKYLKRVIAGGDLCKKSLSNHWKQRVDFYNEYGPTETTVTAIEYYDACNNSVQNNSLPIGKPLPNTSVYILDNNESVCAIGVAGEIYIGGVQVARGYLNRSGLTEESFVPDTFSREKGARMYKTGDMGRWLADGNIEFLGRNNDQVKIRGYRIEPGEIETVLLQSGWADQAVVMAGKDIDGNNMLVGYVVPHGSFNRDAIISFLQNKLPQYMIPALWISLDTLPITHNGKIDRKALIGETGLIHKGIVDPGNELEYEITGIWKEILDVQRIGIHDNFFELGGHSLKAIQLISRLNKRFRIKLDMGKIFSNPTIKEICQLIPAENRHEFIEIPRLPLQENYELSHAQKRIWVLSHFRDGSTAYSIPAVFVLEGNVQVAILKQAFAVIIQRHETLRTVFVEVNDEPRQQILPVSDISFTIEEFDIRANPAAENIIKEEIEKEARRPFDLTKGPLLRVTLFRQSAEKYIVVCNIHHIVSDGWSKGILINELLLLYKNFSTGIESKLTSLIIQYKDYAAWQATTSASQGDYWRRLYEKDIPVLDFPTDYARPKVISFSGALIQTTLSEELTLGLQKLATKSKMTGNNLLLSLYGMMVAQYSRQDEVVIGSLISERSHTDLENLVGLFINFLPVRLSVKSYLTLAEYLKNSNDVLVASYSHKDYPFDLMVSDCIHQRDISRNPFFDTMLNFHWENDLKGNTQINRNQLSDTGLTIKPYPLKEDDFFQAVLDFKLDVEPVDNKLDFQLSYNSNLFTRERMNGFLEGFVELLASVVTEPDHQLYEYYRVPVKKMAVLPAEPGFNSNLMVYISSSFVAEPLQEYIEYWSKEFSLNAEVAFAPYNQVFQQLLDPESALNNNRGMNVLFIRIEDWLRDIPDRPLGEQVQFVKQTCLELLKALDHAGKNSFAPFLMGIVPPVSPHSAHPDIVALITELNNKLESELKNKPGFSIINLSQVASLYFVEELFDPKSDELGHIPFTQEYYAAIGTYISRKIRAYTGHTYKVIVVDCDNTLWKGVCGEDGALGVTIDENFLYLQKFLLEKYNEGFLLALCSKNNETDVWEVFNRNPDMLLKREHITSYSINWNNKHDNIVAIANELNVALDSFIFLDDSSFEVEQMSSVCPEVLSLSLPEDANDFFNFLNHNWAFDRFQTTKEDWQRNALYNTEKLRKEEKAKYVFLNEFLQSLNIEISLRMIEEKDLLRAVQLTQRTNQFNLNGIRRSQENIVKSMRQPGSLNWIIEVKDRFGDYGIVGLLLANRTRDSLALESFMLSCRVLGRNVEDFVLSELRSYCITNALVVVEAQFLATGKNEPFVEFLARTNWVENPGTSTYNFLINEVSLESGALNNIMMVR